MPNHRIVGHCVIVEKKTSVSSSTSQKSKSTFAIKCLKTLFDVDLDGNNNLENNKLLALLCFTMTLVLNYDKLLFIIMNSSNAKHNIYRELSLFFSSFNVVLDILGEL